MRTIMGWIFGVFAMGALLGAGLGGSRAWSPSPSSAPPAQEALAPAPPSVEVACGPGREAVARTVSTVAGPVRRIECVEASRPTFVAAAPTPVAPGEQPSPAAAQRNGERTWKESAVVIGGAAGAGAAVGAVAKGKKGAAVGATAGAVAGTAYELLRRDRR